MKKRHQQKLIILSLFLLAGFNIPLLLIFDKSQSFFGIPVMYLYIFSLWLFSVMVTYLIVKRYYE